MKKLLVILLFACFLIKIPAYSEIYEKKDYAQIYEDIPVLDIYYDFREDPDEIFDYKHYFESPYPLIRTSLNLTLKNIHLKPGYYLLTPKHYSNYDYVMFKQDGKIIGIVPVYQKLEVNPREIYKVPPDPKLKFYKKPWFYTKKLFIKLFGRMKKPPKPPRYKIESKVCDGDKFFLIWLYQEKYLYKMVFKIERTKL